MRCVWILCVASGLVWCWGQLARAQETIEKKVVQLEHEFADADVKGDAASIKRLEAANYTFTGPDGVVTGKQDDVNDLNTGNFKVDAINLDDLKVRVYGNAAVVTGKAMLKKCMWHGKDISGNYQFTDMWAKVNGNWQIVAGQAALLVKQ